MSVIDADLIVVGAGMAGLTTACRAAQAGLRVLVVEKGPKPGGTAAMSGGYLWTASDVAGLSEEDPGGDPLLQATLVNEYPRALVWIRSLGNQLSEEIPIYGFGRGHMMDLIQYIRKCVSLVEEADGHLMCHVRSSDLVRADGRVAGLIVRRDGETALLTAPRVCLATGGFQANKDLVHRYISPNTDRLMLRSNPLSVGDGLTLGLDMGGSLTADAMNGFYGHLVASPLSHLKPGDFTVLTQYNSCFGVLVDRNGDRFTDESKGDHWNAQAVLELEGALAYLIFDERIRRREQILPSLVGELDTTSDKLLECGQRGARYRVADSLPELAAAMSDWGVPEKVLSTVEHFNEVVRSGHGGDLHPARRNLQAAIDEPPYAVLEVMPAITFTYGGLTTDSVGRVLDDQGQAVPGLLAAGADMGGVFRRGYAGGLASALVFGLRAGEEAAAGAVR